MKSRTVKKLYDSLNPRLGPETTETLIAFIDEKIVTEMDNRISHLVTKKEFWEAEKASLERDNELAIRMEKGFADIERRFTVIEGKFGNIYKWMFVCWITQILAIFGFLKYFLP
ncbi:MAG: hypothetical protein J0M30_03190 [Chitinophagales bacterium]|nr:hypothetical protein [Chitinophagales bacterium]